MSKMNERQEWATVAESIISENRDFLIHVGSEKRY